MSLISCAGPVFTQKIMESATINVPVSALREKPDIYEGRLFVFGGVVVSTRSTKEGSLVEGIFTPVDSKGRIEEINHIENRFLALFPKEKGLLNPSVFHANREITIAGKFKELRKGSIRGMEHIFPFFLIDAIHSWKEIVYWNTYPEWKSPYHLPYPYWGFGPWWNYPFTHMVE